jgi:CBS domain-containing protein
MSTVKNILEKKGSDVWAVKPNATVYSALELMAAKNLGAVLVVDDAGSLQGIFSERDYARKIIIKGRNSHTTKVKDIMTARVQYVQPDTTLHECMALMTQKRFRHLPVLDDGKLVGVISIGDVVKGVISEQEAVISQQEFQIDQLEKYIAGSI